MLSTRWKGLALEGVHGLDQGLPAGWETPGFDDRGWKTFRVPGVWSIYNQDYANLTGTALSRLAFEVPAEWAARTDVTFVLGRINGSERTWLNGTVIGVTTSPGTANPAGVARRYPLPAGLLKPGRNVLAFAADYWGYPGITPLGDPRQKQRLEHVTRYLNPEGVRYLSGLYLDQPERLDDPYRYLRW